MSDVHSSVGTQRRSIIRRLFAFSGPAFLVSVGYMDPGNWATDLEAGSRFGYKLLWVLVVSNFLAILLQTLSSRLGIATGRDLAQACRDSYPRPVSMVLYGLSEIAIVACDLAEVLGAAIAINLLFPRISLLNGVLITSLDTLLLLWLQRFGIRYIEAIVVSLIVVISVCFGIEMFLAHPSPAPVFAGLIPHINGEMLFVAVAILGATVMPHNLYLHSALVQTRRIGKSDEEKRQACKYNFIDSTVALNGALLVNAAILIVAAAVFFTSGKVVTEIQQAYQLLSPLVGVTAASLIFAVALLCSGQSSTITGTMAGQIIMEGFLDLRVRPWLRRLVTRSLAVIPAALVVWKSGNSGTFQLLLLSQVILSAQLPFAVIPLIHFTSDKRRMGPFANSLTVRIAAWISAAFIVALNVWLMGSILKDLSEHFHGAVGVWLLTPVAVAMVGLLAWLAFAPAMQKWRRRPVGMQEAGAAVLPVPSYSRILVPLDHSPLDRLAIAHAAALAKSHGAKVFLLHVEEGVTSQVYGSLASTAEVEAGEKYLQDLLSSLHAENLEAEIAVRHSSNPQKEIVHYAKEIHPDLLVMGAHGHGGLKDLIFGNTIDPVRHALRIPILVVRNPARL